MNDIARISFRLAQPIMADPYSENRATGAFILNSGLAKRGAPREAAEGMQGMATPEQMAALAASERGLVSLLGVMERGRLLPADELYDLRFNRVPHPMYQERIPAYETVKHSIVLMRGCFGGCTFCSITEHEGRLVAAAPADPWFPLGTDSLGRDVWSRLVFGARTSLGVASVALVPLAVGAGLIRPALNSLMIKQSDPGESGAVLITTSYPCRRPGSRTRCR